MKRARVKLIDLPPGQELPDDYVAIPMFRSVDQMVAWQARRAVEGAKDVTPT